MDLISPPKWPDILVAGDTTISSNTETHLSSGQVMLCDDLWLKILDYLKLRDLMPMRLVCSGWNGLIVDRLLTVCFTMLVNFSYLTNSVFSF